MGTACGIPFNITQHARKDRHTKAVLISIIYNNKLRGFDTLGKFSTVFLQGRYFLGFSIGLPEHQVPSEKGSTLKGKNLLPQGANSFLLEKTSFRKGGKTNLTELPPLKWYPVTLIMLCSSANS